jgi:hypothetical protein
MWRNAWPRVNFFVHLLPQGLWFMNEGSPFVLHNRCSNKTAVLCLNEKVGSTAWKQAFFKVLIEVGGATTTGGNSAEAGIADACEGGSVFPDLDFETVLQGLKGVGPHHLRANKDIPPWYPTVGEALANRDVPRIMFVRNPHARLVSAYIEKVKARHQWQLTNPWYTRADFDESGGSMDSLVAELARFVGRHVASHSQRRRRTSTPHVHNGTHPNSHDQNRRVDGAIVTEERQKRSRAGDSDGELLNGKGFSSEHLHNLTRYFRRLRNNNVSFWDNQPQRHRVNGHFSPLSQHCELPIGMRYDFYLKVEEMEHWYEPLARLLGISAALSSGWEPNLKWHINPQHQPCFFFKKGCSAGCNGMFAECEGAAGVDNSSAGDADNSRGGMSGMPQTFHSGAIVQQSKLGLSEVLRGDALVEALYSAPLAALVSELFGDDELKFGYPRWDGDAPFPAI